MDLNSNIVAAYDYDEFGNLTEKSENWNFTGVNSVLYSGEFFDDESENYYLRSRYYDPTVGRFTQQDSFLGVDDNPLSLNRYTYCHNNPIRYVDPSGHEARTYSRGDVIYGYNTSQFTSSEQDYQSSVWMGKYERGEIGNEEFMLGMNSIGISMSVIGVRTGGYSGGNSQPSNFIPAEDVVVIFNEQLSLEKSVEAASLFSAYNEGKLNEIALVDGLNKISAVSIKQIETSGAVGGVAINNGVTSTTMLSEEDLKLSEGAQEYILYYKHKWTEANYMYQNATTDSERNQAMADMAMWHNEADDIRRIDPEGKVKGNILSVPIYNQYDVPNNNGTNLCWSTCAAMWISYLLNDNVDRTLDIAIAVATDKVNQGLENGDPTTPAVYNNPREWQSTDSILGISSSLGITASQKQERIELSATQIQETIDSGSPFGVLYRNSNSGHWVLGVGYAMAEGHDTLIISNDPAGGIQKIETEKEFEILPDGRKWTWTAK